jgi:hypothetical protein
MSRSSSSTRIEEAQNNSYRKPASLSPSNEKDALFEGRKASFLVNEKLYGLKKG